MTWEVREGDSVDVLAALDADSIDAIVCDPPYGLEFMGKEWDSFRVDSRAARWSGDERTGGAGAGFAEGQGGASLPSFGKRRTTSLCRTCGKRDAFRNPHKCADASDWVSIPVDAAPMEMRAFQNWVSLWAVEAYRVLKPGGHLLAFGGTRTYHRLAAGIEDAGFDIRDCLMWLYGSGFPKSLDVGRSVDGALGADTTADERWRANGKQRAAPRERDGVKFGQIDSAKHPVGGADYQHVHDEAERWDGWGTALKPAVEPVVVARKPLNGTVAATVLEHGTGALNIDGCRIGTTVEPRPSSRRFGGGPTPIAARGFDGGETQATGDPPAGRWPANVLLTHHPECRAHGTKRSAELCHPDCPIRILNEQSGESISRRSELTSTPGEIYGGLPSHTGIYGYDDEGGAARFFYSGKVKRRERINGVDRNLHPTVKPVDLMRWLVRLVTPPGGLVLDPFLGSGTTGCAAVLEGFDFLGIERDPEYAALARERISSYAFAAR